MACVRVCSANYKSTDVASISCSDPYSMTTIWICWEIRSWCYRAASSATWLTIYLSDDRPTVTWWVWWASRRSLFSARTESIGYPPLNRRSSLKLIREPEVHFRSFFEPHRIYLFVFVGWNFHSRLILIYYIHINSYINYVNETSVTVWSW